MRTVGLDIFSDMPNPKRTSTEPKYQTRQFRMLLLLLCILFSQIFVLSGCVTHPSSNESATQHSAPHMSNKNSFPDKVVVELDISSGRPNPQWVLTRTELDTFQQLLEECPESKTETIDEGLGYRGFKIYTPEGNHKEMSIHNGVIRFIDNNDNVAYYQDPDKEIERWLFNQKRDELDQELQLAIQSSLSE